MGNDSIIFSSAQTYSNGTSANTNTYFYEGGTDTLSFATDGTSTAGLNFNTLSGAYTSVTTSAVGSTGINVVANGTTTLAFIDGLTASHRCNHTWHLHFNRLRQLDQTWLICSRRFRWRGGNTPPFFMLDSLFYWPDELHDPSSLDDPLKKASILIRSCRFEQASSILLGLNSSFIRSSDSSRLQLYECFACSDYSSKGSIPSDALIRIEHISRKIGGNLYIFFNLLNLLATNNYTQFKLYYDANLPLFVPSNHRFYYLYCLCCLGIKNRNAIEAALAKVESNPLFDSPEFRSIQVEHFICCGDYIKALDALLYM